MIVRVVSLFSLFALMACSHTHTDGSPRAPVPKALSGVWRSNCVAARSFGFGETQDISWSTTGFVRTVSFSPRGDCSSRGTELRLSGSYAAFEPSADSAAGDLQWTITEAELTAKTAAQAALLSRAHFCGRDDWQVDHAFNVTEKIGSGTCLTEFPKNIVAAVKTGDKTMSLFEDGARPERRPAAGVAALRFIASGQR